MSDTKYKIGDKVMYEHEGGSTEGTIVDCQEEYPILYCVETDLPTWDISDHGEYTYENWFEEDELSYLESISAVPTESDLDHMFDRIWEKIQEQAINPHISITPDQSPPPTSGCNHEWAKYVGLSDSFEYCIRCDARKENLK